MTKKKQRKHYVDNKKFYAEMKKYIALCREAEEAGEPRPVASDYIGECIYKICCGVAQRPNFSMYTYKDEMIGDGVEVCIRYLHKFNPDKSNNPFSYFSMTAWNAFLQRLTKEKKQALVKAKLHRNSVIINDNSEYFDSTQSGYEVDDGRIAELEEAIKPASKRKKNKK